MSSYKLIIGSRNYSSWSLRGWLAMQQSGADFEEVVIPFHTDERTQLIQEDWCWSSRMATWWSTILWRLRNI